MIVELFIKVSYVINLKKEKKGWKLVVSVVLVPFKNNFANESNYNSKVITDVMILLMF